MPHPCYWRFKRVPGIGRSESRTISSFFVLFWKAKLYADAILQFVYLAISIFGWWNWLFGGEGRTELRVSRTNTTSLFLIAASTAAVTILLSTLLRRFTDSTVPFVDGVTTAPSLTAQYMLSRKLLENWWVWMTADVIYIALYCYKSLYLTGVLYLVFFGMCIAGSSGWYKSLSSRAALAAQEAAAQ